MHVLPAISSHRKSLLLLIGLNVLFYVATQFPVLNLLTMPLNTFVTMMHEMGHATACVLTNGTVTGLTIVSDGYDAAGLTWCRTSHMWAVAPAGYLGATFAGCLFIWLGRSGPWAKKVLLSLGVIMSIATVFTIGKDLFNGVDAYQSVASLVAAFALSGFFFLAGLKFNATVAHLVLLVVAGQTALNSLSSVFLLVQISASVVRVTGLTDATVMQSVCGGPPLFWSILWGATSVIMLLFTLKITYGKSSEPQN